MCKSPSFVWVKRGPEWVQVPVPCDLCWYCRENYVSDWVGRCLCEASVSEVSCTLSLTYATPRNPLDLSYRVVNPHHFQLFMKRLRKAGHKVRYLVAGEYGDLFDRAHFHAILFFSRLVDQGKPAPYLMDRRVFLDDLSQAHPFSRQIPQEEMVHISEWPHGHIQVDWSCTEKSIRYCCEYLNPRAGKKTGWFSMSKKPSLGFEWFAAKAERARDFGVLPSSFEYLPPGGKPGKVYLMTGATRRDYLNMITQDRSERPRMSKWVRATFEKLERQAFVDAADHSAPWADDHFAHLEIDAEKLSRRLMWEDLDRDVMCDKFDEAKAAAFAFDHGFENNEQGWQAFYTEFPDYFDIHFGTYVPWAKHVSGCSCSYCLAGESPPDWRIGTVLEGQASTQSHWLDPLPLPEGAKVKRKPRRSVAKRAPDWFDREGKPRWGPEGREYLAGVFSRPSAGAKDRGSDVEEG